MESVARFVEHRLKLIVNRTKSKVCEIKDAAFLGFTIVKNRIKWSVKSKAKFGARIREWERSGHRQPIGCPKGGATRHQITKRTRGVSPCKVMEELQLFVRGALNYYSLGMTYAEARGLDGWLRRRVRLYYWKQWGRPRARRRNLIKLGINRATVHMASRSRKGLPPVGRPSGSSACWLSQLRFGCGG